MTRLSSLPLLGALGIAACGSPPQQTTPAAAAPATRRYVDDQW